MTGQIQMLPNTMKTAINTNNMKNIWWKRWGMDERRGTGRERERIKSVDNIYIRWEISRFKHTETQLQHLFSIHHRHHRFAKIYWFWWWKCDVGILEKFIFVCLTHIHLTEPKAKLTQWLSVGGFDDCACVVNVSPIPTRSRVSLSQLVRLLCFNGTSAAYNQTTIYERLNYPYCARC